MNELWMQRFSEDLPRVHKGAISSGRKVITFLTERQPEVYNRGRLLSLGEMCADDYEIQHSRTIGNFRYGAISLRPEELVAACKAIVGCEFDTEGDKRYVRPNPTLMEQFLNLHKMVGGIAKTMPELFELREVVRALEQRLTHMLVRCLTDGIVSTKNSGALRHEVIIARFEEFIEANPNTPLYLTEVCAAIGTAERTLRAACEGQVGMGPIRYLTLRRMHLVRRALERAAPSTTTVTQIVTDHGFWELGRFSVAYRTLFGETPSVTLNRPPDEYLDFPSRPSSLRAYLPGSARNAASMAAALAGDVISNAKRRKPPLQD
jgi:AraC-like DNA-binding protein